MNNRDNLLNYYQDQVNKAPDRQKRRIVASYESFLIRPDIDLLLDQTLILLYSHQSKDPDYRYRILEYAGGLLGWLNHQKKFVGEIPGTVASSQPHNQDEALSWIWRLANEAYGSGNEGI